MKRDLLAEIEHDSSDSAPAWMVSYGDLMSLLLTLFVMLVSMSEIKQNDKFQGVADSLHEQFSLNQPAAGGMPGDLKPRSAPLAVLAVSGREARRRAMQTPRRDVATQSNGESSPRTVSANQTAATAGAIAFAPRSSELAGDAIIRLQAIAESVSGKPHAVEVRGLAETGDDLELAWQRSLATARHLIDQYGIESERIRITVAAQSASIAKFDPTDTPEKPMVEVFLVEESPARYASRPDSKP